jgi:hypothetical protein
VPQRRFDARMGLDELPQEAAEPKKLGIEDRADAQRAADFVPQRGSGALHIGGGGERAFGVRKKGFSVARQQKAVRRPREKDDAERFLQIFDLEADGGLCEMQLRGGTREIAFTSDGEKGAKKGVVHA